MRTTIVVLCFLTLSSPSFAQKKCKHNARINNGNGEHQKHNRNNGSNEKKYSVIGKLQIGGVPIKINALSDSVIEMRFVPFINGKRPILPKYNPHDEKSFRKFLKILYDRGVSADIENTGRFQVAGLGSENYVITVRLFEKGQPKNAWDLRAANAADAFKGKFK